MEAKLKQESIQQFTCVYTNTLSREETVESVVPDTMPDIERILDTECTLFLRSKNAQDGKAFADGSLQASILYLAEESNDILRLELTKPVTFAYESEALSEQDHLCVRMQIHNADTRSLNPRKILLRVDLQSELSAYRSEEFALPSDKENEENLQILPGECPWLRITHIGEKVFSVSEEFSLPAAHAGVGEILTAKGTAVVDEWKVVGEKMILQGTVTLKLLYIPSDESNPKAERFTATFSQIMDCPENADGPHTILIMPTSLRLEPMAGNHGVPVLLMDMHLTAQLICRKQSTLHYIADAYSLAGCEELETQVVSLCTAGDTMVLRDTIRDLLETTEPAAEILDGWVQPGVPTAGERGMRVPLSVRVLYRTESGAVSGVSRRLQVDMACETMQGKGIYLHPLRWNDVYFAPAAGGVEVRLPVELKVELYETSDISAIRSVTVNDEEKPADYDGPSLTVVRCRDTNLWALAKRYRTTKERIELANKNAPEIGQLLLIPRSR